MKMNRPLALALLLCALLPGLASSPAWARTFYVATDGDDAHAGTSRDHAWRSVNHAAAQVVAGDTVLIAGGVYTESVRIRATGEAGNPITFKATPGEKVVFSGSKGALNYAFYASGKHHLRFDGFYFVQFSGLDNYVLPWSDTSPGNGYSGMIALHDCRDVQITRCFADGRGLMYAPGLVIARHCTDLLVRNCVTVSGIGGSVSALYCPNIVVEHCVFLVPLIQATYLQNHKHQTGALRNSIFTDNITIKARVSILYNSEPIDAGTTNNCFFLRVPAQQRGWDTGGTLSAWMASIAATHQHGEGQGQIAMDPRFQGAIEAPPLDVRGNPLFRPDFLVEKADLDFPDLFATEPEVVRRGIGLQAEAFADFHFARTRVTPR